jgi:PAS domain-containing protein
VAFEVLLGVADASMGKEVVLTTAFVLGPFALAITGRPRQVARVGALATALAIASGWWNDYAGSGDHLMRIAIVALGSTLATLAARALGRAAGDRARMEVLAAVGRLSGTQDLDQALQGIRQALIPAVAETVWIDAPERVLETGPIAPDLEKASSATQAQGQSRLVSGNAATIPLKTTDDASGVLGLARSRPYDHNDLAFFEILAGRVALVLANVRLFADLRSTRARLDGILGALAEAVTVHDEHGQTVYANRAAADLLGPPGRAGPALHDHQGERRAGQHRRAPRETARPRRARPGTAHAQRGPRHRQGLLAADEGNGAA